MDKETKAKLTTLFAETWGEDSKMVKYCVNQAFSVFEMRGKIFVIDKKSIHKDFCFGYSDSKYDTEEYDHANAMAEMATKNQMYFIRENHRRAYAPTISMLNSWRWKAYARQHYYKGENLYVVHFCREYDDIPKDAWELTNEEKALYKRELAKAAVAHHKRIMTYLKKYGLSKVNSWSYWRDE